MVCINYRIVYLLVLHELFTISTELLRLLFIIARLKITGYMNKPTCSPSYFIPVDPSSPAETEFSELK
jgi:hypothetical protein